MFKGSIVAIVTPFRNGAVDEEKLRELVEFQIANGTDGIVPCGTTGEASTLDYDEHMDVVRIVVEQVGKRVPVIAGTGSNSTAEAIELTEKAKDLIIAEAYDPTYGARPLKRTIQRRILDPLAVRVLQGDFREGDTVLIDVKAGSLVFDKAETGVAA